VSILSTEIIHVYAGKGYDIHIQKGIIGSTGELVRTVKDAHRAVIITDSTVAPLYAGIVKKSLEAAGFNAFLFVFPAGEASKNHKTLLDIYAYLAKSELTRSDIIVALGGGVTGDVAGFAAATWQRGIDFVQIPTTLLAQVDSSIGGKTAVDLPEGKNLVGAFWQPSLVLCDPQTLSTLDSTNIACGMGEIIKHACIRSKELFDFLLETQSVNQSIVRLIAENLKIKRDVVERDEREKGERMLLNFGHTLGHAIEKLNHFTGITHGEAVAIGMATITRYSEKKGMTEAGTYAALVNLLEKHGLPSETSLPLCDMINAAKGDKKRAGGDIHLVLLKRLGEGFVYRLPIVEMPAFFDL
jgi:3-dehydroquinate synthase